MSEATKKVLALIEKIIEEHKVIMQRTRALERITNDPSAMLELERAKEDFVPSRIGDQRQAIHVWRESVEAVDEGLQAHFDREEQGLLTAFEQHGDRMLSSALHILFLEHEELRNRLARLKTEADELAAGGLPREIWEGKAWGLRVYVTQTRKLIDAHAKSEQELLHTLKNKLMSNTKESN